MYMLSLQAILNDYNNRSKLYYHGSLSFAKACDLNNERYRF